MIDVEKTIREAEAEMQRLGDAEVVVKIPLLKAMVLLSTVQVALRHPMMPDGSREIAENFCTELIELIGRASPVLEDFCRIGFDERCDVPPDKMDTATVQEVVTIAQAVLTALNVGAIEPESPIHIKLREVMIAFRAGLRE